MQYEQCLLPRGASPSLDDVDLVDACELVRGASRRAAAAKESAA